MRLYFKVSEPHRRIASLLCLLTLLLWNLSDAIAQTKSLPIQGRIGVGTWETQAEFKDIKVTCPTIVSHRRRLSKLHARPRSRLIWQNRENANW